jgi:beta-N-acetylglucosaminidase
MQFKKAIAFSLVVSLFVMTLFPVLIKPRLSDNQKQQENASQELRETKEKLDDQNQLLIEEIDRKNALKKELDEYKQAEAKIEEEAQASRSAINDYDISRPSGRTAEEIEKLVIGTALEGLGIAFYQAEQACGINAIFIAAVARLESGNGITYLAKTKNNLFGLNAWGSTREEINRRAYSYASKADSILAFARIIRENYIDKGRNTVKTVSEIYCEKADFWYDKISVLMEENVKILNE